MDDRHYQKLFFLLQLHEKVLGYPKMAKTRAMIEAQLADFESAQDAPKADPAPAPATPAVQTSTAPLKLNLAGKPSDE